jgi:hypothetical protein
MFWTALLAAAEDPENDDGGGGEESLAVLLHTSIPKTRGENIRAISGA